MMWWSTTALCPVRWLSGNPYTVIIALVYGYLPFFIVPLYATLDRIDGRPTALVEGNPSRVLISRPGRSTLTLEVVVPVTSQGGAESMTLPSSGSALSSVTFTVPKTGVDLSVAGGFVAERRDSTAESRWVAYGSAGRALSFAWKRKADDRRGALPLRTRARITELVALGEDSNQITANVQFEVTQGLAREAVIAIPAGVIVNHVTGPTVADWNVDRGSLTVSVLEPVASQASVVVSGEWRAAREGTIAIPLMNFRDERAGSRTMQRN